jgi:hypothetical protein
MPTGDPLEDAFRTELGNVLTAASIPWPLKDTENTGVQPKPSESWVDIRFEAPTETPRTWGSPGSNLWRERGDVEIGVFTRRNTGHDLLGTYALAIRNAFRDRRFSMTTGQSIKIETVTPLQAGRLEGAWWMRSVVLSYKVTNVG